MTVVCREGPAYYTMQGTARIGKAAARYQGTTLPCWSCREADRPWRCLTEWIGRGSVPGSTLVIELLEELLDAGFPEKTAIQMINTTLVMGREEIHYSTVDMTVFDLYTGECEIIKAGASSTFIKKKELVEHLSSTSLPIGVMNAIEIDSVKRQLSDGDFVIMVPTGCWTLCRWASRICFWRRSYRAASYPIRRRWLIMYWSRCLHGPERSRQTI